MKINPEMIRMYPDPGLRTWAATRLFLRITFWLLVVQCLLGDDWIRRQVRRDRKLGLRALRWLLRDRSVRYARTPNELSDAIKYNYERHYLDAQMLASAKWCPGKPTNAAT